MSRRLVQLLQVYGPYALLALAVMAPLLRPGYILTLDAVFVPHLAAPSAVASDYLWRMLLHILNLAVPGDVLEKLIFLGIIFGSGVWAHQLVRYLFVQTSARRKQLPVWIPYAGGVLYTINPFTYDRFMAGQYGVLLGYMLLPLVCRLLLEFITRPEKKQMFRLVAAAVALSILSLPTLGLFALLAACAIITLAWRQGHDGRQAYKRLAVQGLVGIGLFALLSCYWLIPLLAGKGATAGQIQGFTAAHTAAFAATGSSFAARVFAVLRLQGFWAESHQLFKLPQDVLPGWGTVRLLVWTLVTTGAVGLWRASRQLGAFFTLLLVAGMLLAAGMGSGLLTHLGYREPQKFTACVALAFAVFAAYGAHAAYAWALQKRQELWQGLLPAAVALVILLFTPGIYWGFGGQLSPRHYPAGWSSAAEYLRAHPGRFNTVFLPWHQYMSFGFSGRVIASPGNVFFPHTIVSNDPELGAITPPKNASVTQIGQALVPQAPHNALGPTLTRYNVRYILLAKDYDYTKYAYLQHAPGLRLVSDDASLALYENQTWKGTQ